MQTIAMWLVLEGTPTYTPPVLCIIFGGVLLALAIVGGGLRAKEIEIPSMNLWTRGIAGFCGAALLIYGLKIAAQSTIPIADKLVPSKAEQPISPKLDEIHLVPLKCATANSLKSESSAAETTVLFVNQTTTPVNLLWIDQQGERKQWATLNPKNMDSDHVRLKTYEGHVWLIQSAQGACLEAFVALPQDTIANITMNDF
jgi:hypothetical protein